MSSVTQPNRFLPPVVSSMSSLDNGVSHEAKMLFDTLKLIRSHSSQSFSGQALQYVLNDIEIVVTENSHSNWDGCGAEPISQEAASDASIFLSLLPSALPMPEIVPEPDGDIGLEWEKDRDNWLIVSCGKNKIISYAWKISGQGRGDGNFKFSGGIPKTIIYIIQILF